MICKACGVESADLLEDDHSSLQRKGYHAMIEPLAKARKWSKPALKLYFLGRIFGWYETEDFTTGEVFRVPKKPHTSDLSKRDYSTLIEMTVVLAAQDGFELIPPSDWLAEQAAKRERAA